MLFASYGFIAFCVAVLLFYYLLPKKAQWPFLLIASYFFYAFSGWKNLIFIAVTTVSTYLFGLLIGRMSDRASAFLAGHKETMPKEERKAYKEKERKKRLWVLLACLCLNFGILAVLKYTGFAVSVTASVFGKSGEWNIPDLLLPMGISFYVFSSMSYVIDLYRGKDTAEKNLFRFALFVSFFPVLVQGPISRHGDLAPQLYEPHFFSVKTVSFGLWRVLWGYFKKLVVADRVLPIVLNLTDETRTGGYVALLILLYSIEIYADFTGGIDITVGLAEAMGIKLTENFRQPFSSHSTKEYWNRWHITMGSWFNDYIFLPLSASGPLLSLGKWCRKHIGEGFGKRVSVYLATIVTWFVTGLWHGAGWNFIVWGLLNCFVLLVSRELEPLYAKFHRAFPKLDGKQNPVYGGFMAVRTFLLMGLIRSLDCYRDVPTTFRLWGTLVTTWNYGEVFRSLSAIGLDLRTAVIVGVSVALFFLVGHFSKTENVREKLFSGRPALSCALFGLLLLCVLLFGAYGVGYDASQFIYNQF